MSTLAPAPAFARPGADEHDPYYGKYINLVPEGDLVAYLRRQGERTAEFLRGIPEHLHEHRYAEGKWSVKEVVGHLSDVERVMSYRALRFARADETPVPGFDENTYVPAANFDARSLDSLVEEYASVRAATLTLLASLDEAAARRRGTANEREISVRALAYIIAGHIDHHVALLKERYLATV